MITDLYISNVSKSFNITTDCIFFGPGIDLPGRMVTGMLPEKTRNRPPADAKHDPKLVSNWSLLLGVSVGALIIVLGRQDMEIIWKSSEGPRSAPNT